MNHSYQEPNISSRTINSIDDLKSALAWLGVGASSSSYIGRVDSAGVAVSLPAGWTSARNGTGDYTITHNLGSAAYIVLLQSDGAASVPVIHTRGSNSLRTTFFSLAASLTDTSFDFQIIIDDN
jgi:hypothetical protein